MTEPTTVNIGLIVPNTGDLVDTWGTNALNVDYVALDGFLGGVVTISAGSTPITLTAPSGSITPSPGPTQSQNRILKFTGTLSANVKVTLPLPGEYVIQNLTTGNFVLSFQPSGGGHIVAVPQGQVTKIWTDGTDAWLILNTIPGQSIFLNGISSVPAWITACTIPPFLLEDGSVYQFATFPALGGQLGNRFGGNGVTTFAVPSSGGRLKLAYDYTGARITVAGCGINGQSIGANADNQSSVLNGNNVPAYTPVGSITGSATIGLGWSGYGNASFPTTGLNHVVTDIVAYPTGALGNGVFTVNTGSLTFSGNSNGGSSAPFSNVPPALVAGISLIAT